MVDSYTNCNETPKKQNEQISVGGNVAKKIVGLCFFMEPPTEMRSFL